MQIPPYFTEESDEMLALGLLMLWAGVALVQNKKFFTSAPKDIQAVIQEKPERRRKIKVTTPPVKTVYFFRMVWYNESENRNVREYMQEKNNGLQKVQERILYQNGQR